VTNTGDRAGREVVQAYVSVPGSRVTRPPRELKGFAAVTLQPRESREVVIPIAREDLTFWSVLDRAWILEGGEYRIHVGSSSRDLRSEASLEVAGDEPPRPLTLESTVAEMMANPAAAAVAQQALGGVFGGHGHGHDPDPDLERMFAEIPAYALAGFTGLGTATFQAVLDEANRAAELTH
jgi:beta-glucosidase